MFNRCAAFVKCSAFAAATKYWSWRSSTGTSLFTHTDQSHLNLPFERWKCLTHSPAAFSALLLPHVINLFVDDGLLDAVPFDSCAGKEALAAARPSSVPMMRRQWPPLVSRL
jgi:hypothetical protein